METPHPSTRMFRVKEVATRLNVHVSTVYRLIESGQLNSVRVGMGKGTVRVPEESLDSYLHQLGFAQIGNSDHGQEATA